MRFGVFSRLTWFHGHWIQHFPYISKEKWFIFIIHFQFSQSYLIISQHYHRHRWVIIVVCMFGKGETNLNRGVANVVDAYNRYLTRMRSFSGWMRKESKRDRKRQERERKRAKWQSDERIRRIASAKCENVSGSVKSQRAGGAGMDVDCQRRRTVCAHNNTSITIEGVH